jgi:hypothetical protein
MSSVGTGAEKRKQKWKHIPSKFTSIEETHMDIAHEEYLANYSKKKK